MMDGQIHDINMVAETIKKIQADIDYAVNKSVLGTPTIVVHGKRYAGIKPYYELKEILKNNE